MKKKKYGSHQEDVYILSEIKIEACEKIKECSQSNLQIGVYADQWLHLLHISQTWQFKYGK